MVARSLLLVLTSEIDRALVTLKKDWISHYQVQIERLLARFPKDGPPGTTALNEGKDTSKMMLVVKRQGLYKLVGDARRKVPVVLPELTSNGIEGKSLMSGGGHMVLTKDELGTVECCCVFVPVNTDKCFDPSFDAKESNILAEFIVKTMPSLRYLFLIGSYTDEVATKVVELRRKTMGIHNERPSLHLCFWQTPIKFMPCLLEFNDLGLDASWWETTNEFTLYFMRFLNESNVESNLSFQELFRLAKRSFLTRVKRGTLYHEQLTVFATPIQGFSAVSPQRVGIPDIVVSLGSGKGEDDAKRSILSSSMGQEKTQPAQIRPYASGLLHSAIELHRRLSNYDEKASNFFLRGESDKYDLATAYQMGTLIGWFVLLKRDFRYTWYKFEDMNLVHWQNNIFRELTQLFPKDKVFAIGESMINDECSPPSVLKYIEFKRQNIHQPPWDTMTKFFRTSSQHFEGLTANDSNLQSLVFSLDRYHQAATSITKHDHV